MFKKAKIILTIVLSLVFVLLIGCDFNKEIITSSGVTTTPNQTTVITGPTITTGLPTTTTAPTIKPTTIPSTSTTTTNPSFDLSNVFYNDKTYVYDGKEKVLEIDGSLPDGLTIYYENNCQTEIGQYTAVCNIYYQNRLLKELSATLTILDPNSSLNDVTFDDVTYEYDGNEHFIYLNGELPNGLDVKYENNRLTDVGYTKAKATVYMINTNAIIRTYEAYLTIKDTKTSYTYLSDIAPSYKSVGAGSLVIDKDSAGNKLTLLTEGELMEYDKGFFAHAYSVLVFEGLESRGYTTFSTYMGLNKTALTNQSVASVKFKIYLDNELKYESTIINKNTSCEFASLDITGVDRITLIADSLDGNGNDHAVWANPILSYKGKLGAYIKATDISFSSPDKVYSQNILHYAYAYDENGKDISSELTYRSNYIEGEIGEFEVTFYSTYNNIVVSKTVKLIVENEEAYKAFNETDLHKPFANTVYYGYWLLSPENRKAYSLILESLLNADLSNPCINTININLYNNGIYVFPDDMKTIKSYISMDEPRVYFIYYWKAGDHSAGVSFTKKDGFVDTVSIDLFNREGQYYYQQDYNQILLDAEKNVSNYMSGLEYDMTQAQMSYSVQTKFQSNMTYANIAYADSFYGAFILKKGICSGYTRGLQYLNQRVGIQAAYDNGGVPGAHAWTLVYVENEWYMSDATWGIYLVGQKYFNDSGRISYNPYGVFPSLAADKYNVNLLKYPLISFLTDSILVQRGDKNFSIESLISGTTDAPIVSVEYDELFNVNYNGTYKLNVTAINSIGNIMTKKITIRVGDFSNFNLLPIEAIGSGNYGFQSVSLYLDGNEINYQNGWYLKTTNQYYMAFDLTGLDYDYFETYYGIEGQIRNGAWGFYANATFEFIVDDEVVLKTTNVGWKTNQKYALIDISNAKNLTIRVTDTSGQGRTAFGNPRFFK